MTLTQWWAAYGWIVGSAGWLAGLIWACAWSLRVEDQRRTRELLSRLYAEELARQQGAPPPAPPTPSAPHPRPLPYRPRAGRWGAP